MACQIPTEREAKRAWLLDAVDTVRDAVEAGVEDAERERTLPRSTFEALTDAGLFMLKVPSSLGGAEADPLIQLDVIEALARIDASAAWAVMIASQSTAMPAVWLPDDAVATMFAGDPLPLVAGSLMPSGTAAHVDGGFRVNGRWGFASGIRHCDWVNATVRVEGSDDGVLHRVVLPTNEVIVHDNWDAIGLAGSGSCDFSVEDRFVPEEFSWRFGEPPRRGSELYLLGLPGYVANEHAAIALGIAAHVRDLIIGRAGRKGRGFAGSLIGDRGAFQRDLGRFDLQLTASRAMVVDVYERVWANITPDRPPTPQEQAELRSAAALATDHAVEMVGRLFRYAGGEALFAGDPLQRCWRDLVTAAQHFLVNDTAYEAHGKFLLGHDDAVPFG